MRKKILIVDDNAELLALLCEAIRSAGFAVTGAGNGIEALAKTRNLRPDLLVLDLVLPEMDGFGVCEAIRRDREFAQLPVIMLTGLTSEFTRYAGLESGANEYVKKPVSPSVLVSKIRQWLDSGNNCSQGKSTAASFTNESSDTSPREEMALKRRSAAVRAATHQARAKGRRKNFFP